MSPIERQYPGLKSEGWPAGIQKLEQQSSIHAGVVAFALPPPTITYICRLTTDKNASCHFKRQAWIDKSATLLIAMFPRAETEPIFFFFFFQRGTDCSVCATFSEVIVGWMVTETWRETSSSKENKNSLYPFLLV